MVGIPLLKDLEIFKRFVRRDTHAERWYDARTRRWGYRPVLGELTEAMLLAHLTAEGPHLGVYLMEPETSVTRVAALDLDDHDGSYGWAATWDTAVKIVREAARWGLLCGWYIRSGGGHGVHLFFFWETPQPAAEVRAVLQRVLATEGLQEGTSGGLAGNVVEIFPKQPIVERGAYGSLIALPFARGSVHLDQSGQPYAGSRPIIPSDPVPGGYIEQEAPGEPDDGVADAAILRDALSHIDAEDYATWITVGLALKGGIGESAITLWDEYSKKSKKYVGTTEVQAKWTTFKGRKDGVGLGTIFHMARANGWAGSPGRLPPAFSEDALALRFADKHERDLRYVSQWGKWYIWDDNYWRLDNKMQSWSMVRRMCREESSKSKTNKATLVARAKVAAVHFLAQTDRRLAAVPEQWDTDPWLLGTPRGTVDLHTGALMPSRREDYITQTAKAWPEGECPRWLGFLNEVTNGDAEMQRYLQRIVGYSLTGVTREEVVIFIHGEGGNGKGTFIETVAAAMGGYSDVVAMDTLIMKKYHDHPTEIAKLRGVRLAVASETSDGSRWNMARLKLLTGGDKLTGRFMRADFFDFRPTHKLIISGNKRPGLGRVDAAIVRRLFLVPFMVKISVPDKDLKAYFLDAELNGIMRWAVQGCLEWQRMGLAPPKAVVAATEEYLHNQDDMQVWMDDCCVLQDKWRSSSAELFQSWQKWCERTGGYVGAKRQFVEGLIERGFRMERGSHNQTYLFGIRLARDEDDMHVVSISPEIPF